MYQWPCAERSWFRYRQLVGYIGYLLILLTNVKPQYSLSDLSVTGTQRLLIILKCRYGMFISLELGCMHCSLSIPQSYIIPTYSWHFQVAGQYNIFFS